MNLYVEWESLGQVIVAGLLVGAGLPALFALGLRLLAPRAGSAADDAGVGAVTGAGGVGAATASPAAGTVSPAGGAVRPSGIRLVGAVVCFAVVVAAVVAGIVFLVAGGH